MNELIIATKNKGKAIEFERFFQDMAIDIKSLLDYPDPNDELEIKETGTTFTENAILKAEAIATLFNTAVLADDSGLMIDALDGRPGIYSARYAGENKSDEANIEKVLAELSEIPLKNRTARFVCVLAISIPNEETIVRTGYCEGEISFSRMGENGFGYDPIFIPAGFTKTMAQISSDEKSKISHRSQAMKNIVAHIREASLHNDTK
ncbi:MAG TPA: XTP/dITP diphosphatase [Virgibacillus sp.]|nr:XTP/dITP diphosphatase [Virgibacillus sp.]